MHLDRFWPRGLERLEAKEVSMTLSASAVRARSARPHWDGDRRHLWYKGSLVKQFRGRPSTQELILAVFEEEGWPPRIDDPLPPKGDLDPKTRLRNTIARLNRAQRNALLWFEADGRGGVLWSPREER
jgi:hypothetical protein